MKKMKTVWFEAGNKVAWDAYSKKAERGKVYCRRTEKEELCLRCINRVWAPPAPLLYNYVATDQQRCSMCGCYIEPSESVRKRLQAKRKSEGQSAWEKREGMRERARLLHEPTRVEYIIGSPRRVHDVDPDT